MSDDEISRANMARKGTPYLGVKQASFYLGVSAKTLQRLRVAGGGPPFRKMGATVRYHVDDLTAWCKSETITRLPPKGQGGDQ